MQLKLLKTTIRKHLEEVDETDSMLALEASAPEQIQILTIQDALADLIPFVISTLSDLEWWTAMLQYGLDHESRSHYHLEST